MEDNLEIESQGNSDENSKLNLRFFKIILMKNLIQRREIHFPNYKILPLKHKKMKVQLIFDPNLLNAKISQLINIKLDA